MSFKSILYLTVLVAALLLLAVGGWLAKGLKAFVGQTTQPGRRPLLSGAGT
ncbi:MAG TPA: hypothetical protein VFA19_01285 [Gaiellaceae bacterium]|nr:hypothetical protein [Gaiellaceae bacterium]